MANPASRFYFPSAIVAKGEREEEEEDEDEEEEEEENEDQQQDRDRKILDLSGVSTHRIEVIESSDEDEHPSDFILRPSSDISVPPSPRDPPSLSDPSLPSDPSDLSAPSPRDVSETPLPLGLPSESSGPSFSGQSPDKEGAIAEKGQEGQGKGAEEKGKAPEGPGKGQVAAAFIDQLQLPRSSSSSSFPSSGPSSSSSSSFVQTRSLGSSSSLITDPKSLSSSSSATIDLRLRGVNTGARKAVAMKGQGAMKEVQSRLQFYEAKPVQTLTSLQEVSRIVRNAHSDFSAISRLSSSFRSFCLLTS
eukprot:TRINITY_DN888_c0_g1_i2.p1 TRINITY_DN888_c0_g1~~TRINITY_DN888_c0_g1_i2.p1  ORF type:complete len:314 (+),score=135.26 TRINITY_DN888_c0_g1_i2:29-943(+)